MTSSKNSRPQKPFGVLGVEIGTGTGWDQMDYWTLVIYDFIPATGFPMPEADLFVDYQTGKFYNYDDEGKIILEKTIFSIMKDFFDSSNINYQKSKN